MIKEFNAPIPGQSLTTTPKNYSWERPPLLANLDDVVERHIKQISKPDAIDNILFVLEAGLPINVLVEVFLTNAVSKGIHNIDVSLLVAPILHKEILQLARTAEIDFKEYFDDSKVKEENKKGKAIALLRKALREDDNKEDAGVQILTELTETLEEPTEKIEEKEKPKGLMSRTMTDGN